MKITKLTEKDFKTTNWSGGTTTQLFIYPPMSEYSKRDFLLRISSATVDLEKSDFTVLPNIKRFIAPLTCDLKISHDEKYFTKLKPFEIYAFDGGAKTVSIGKARDFNVMIKDGVEASVKNFFLNQATSLKFSIAQDELGWLFSFNNKGELNINENEDNTSHFSVANMELFIFKKENANNTHDKESVIISANSNMTLFYGKIKFVGV